LGDGGARRESKKRRKWRRRFDETKRKERRRVESFGGLGKGKAVKRCKIAACVVGLSAAFGVGVVAFDGVSTESVATAQDGIQRGPVAFEKMAPGENARITRRKSLSFIAN